jgi:N-acetyltransferase
MAMAESCAWPAPPISCRGSIWLAMFELQPHLVGTLLELRPLTPEDWPALSRTASDPLIWEVHPVSDRWKPEVFREFFDYGLASGGAFVVIDRANGAIIGSSRYSNYKPADSEIEIGSTFLARSHWGGVYHGEMKRLMLDHAFQFVETVVFRIGATNVRSRRAIEKIGGGLTERIEIIHFHGRSIEHVVYAIRRPGNS